MIQKTARFLLAFIFLMSGGFGILALISYTAADPSLNTASMGPALNWMGAPGADVADFLMQACGQMAFLLPLAFFVWGAFLLFRDIRLKGRIYALLGILLLGCWLLADVPAKHLNELTDPQGGYLGFYLKQWIGNHLWYVQFIGWFLIAVASVYVFKIPFLWIMRHLWALIGKGISRRSIPIPTVLPQSVQVLKKVRLPKKKEVKHAKKESALASIPKIRKSDFVLPTVDLLNPAKAGTHSVSADQMNRISRELEQVLAQFRVNGHVVRANPGPVVTLYEFEPASGVKTAVVIGLADDIAREMRVVSVRIAVVPGSNVIGIEMPNQKRDTVYIREMVENAGFKNSTGVLPLILGKDIGGKPVFADLAKMPHLLVAGTTGSGKSVAINTMILSLLYRFTPAECRMIMVDPKMLELSVYNGIPHLLTPVVTDAGKAVVALKWAVREMEDRYRAMSQLGVRNIDGYNQKLLEAAASGKKLTRRVQTGFDMETGAPIIEEQALDLTPIPYIVVIVDEMADLMLVAGKEVEAAIQRLAQMARAAGIHLIMATQRPSVDVITGTIKANFPSRISFQVTSKIDSRTILGEQGAEQLLGRGDMLYMPAGQRPHRVHGPFVSDDEIEKVVSHLRNQGEPAYVKAVLEEPAGGVGNAVGAARGAAGNGSGDLYDQAVAVVLRDKKPTTSYLQRQFRIGYNKAADLIDRMEAEGIISKPNIAGKREILVPTDNA